MQRKVERFIRDVFETADVDHTANGILPRRADVSAAAARIFEAAEERDYAEAAEAAADLARLSAVLWRRYTAKMERLIEED